MVSGTPANPNAMPCCVHGCTRFGTRLVGSLRSNWELKPDHSGRVCEGHYRKSLRMYKKIQSLGHPRSSSDRSVAISGGGNSATVATTPITRSRKGSRTSEKQSILAQAKNSIKYLAAEKEAEKERYEVDMIDAQPSESVEEPALPHEEPFRAPISHSWPGHGQNKPVKFQIPLPIANQTSQGMSQSPPRHMLPPYAPTSLPAYYQPAYNPHMYPMRDPSSFYPILQQQHQQQQPSRSSYPLQFEHPLPPYQPQQQQQQQQFHQVSSRPAPLREKKRRPELTIPLHLHGIYPAVHNVANTGATAGHALTPQTPEPMKKQFRHFCDIVLSSENVM